MAESNRKLSGKFVAELKSDYSKLLNEILSDSELRLEIRNEVVSVYYKRYKALDISINDKDEAKKANENPKNYFNEKKKEIDDRPGNSLEFEIQQNIATTNSYPNNSKYIIIEMEYGPSQGNLTEDRVHGKDDKTRTPAFDLLGIESGTGNIIIFELKRGTESLGKGSGKGSGIKDHLEDFKDFFRKKKEIFLPRLKKDIEGIIDAKRELGVLGLPDKNSIKYENIGFMFVFAPSVDEKQKEEDDKYEQTYKELIKESDWKDYPTIFINSKDCDLSKGRLWPET
jgi:hypothetical protein